METTLPEWGILALAAILVGVTKTSIPGLGIVIVSLLTLAFPAKASTGLLLPMLAFADPMAVLYYRRHAKWRHVTALLPWSLAGIGIGTIVVRRLNDTQFEPILGGIVLGLLVLQVWRRPGKDAGHDARVRWAFAAGMGLLAGFTTQIANAAGSIVTLYLLAAGLPKKEFVGTGAWYYLILNWLKIPIFISEGRITAASFLMDLTMLPFIFLGAVLGIWVLKRMPQTAFRQACQVLAGAGAVKLILSALRLW